MDINDEINIEVEKEKFRNRVTELRLSKNVSESNMSLELGKARNFVQRTVNGTTFPRFEAIVDICDYFGITLSEFFDYDSRHPMEQNEINAILKSLHVQDAEMILNFARRLYYLTNAK